MTCSKCHHTATRGVSFGALVICRPCWLAELPPPKLGPLTRRLLAAGWERVRCAA